MNARDDELDELGGGMAAGTHRGVERIAFILQFAASSNDGVRLADVASRLGAPRSSIHSLLKGLVSVGFLEESAGRYVIGVGIHDLLAPHRTATILDVARDDVEALSRSTGETALLGALRDDAVVYVFQAESTESIRYTARLGEPRPLYPTSTGKLFLASMDNDAVRAYRNSLAGVDATLFDAEIEQVRRTGIAYNREETVKGTTAVAAAIRDSDGRPIAAISVVGPVYRMHDKLHEFGADVLELAKQISYRFAAQA
jgi:DNA-binding IclR family transcriptional regulator